MAKDWAQTIIQSLAFYGKITVKYNALNGDIMQLNFTLNKDNSIAGICSFSSCNYSFPSIEGLKTYLQGIKEQISYVSVI